MKKGIFVGFVIFMIYQLALASEAPVGFMNLPMDSVKMASAENESGDGEVYSVAATHEEKGRAFSYIQSKDISYVLGNQDVLDKVNKRYRIYEDDFYKILIRSKGEDERAFLLFNGRLIEEENVRKLNDEIAELGPGVYSFFEWRMIEKPQSLNIFALILGKRLSSDEMIYQIFKLNNEASCSLETFVHDLEEARKFADRLECS